MVRIKYSKGRYHEIAEMDLDKAFRLFELLTEKEGRRCQLSRALERYLLLEEKVAELEKQLEDQKAYTVSCENEVVRLDQSLCLEQKGRKNLARVITEAIAMIKESQRFIKSKQGRELRRFLMQRFVDFVNIQDDAVLHVRRVYQLELDQMSKEDAQKAQQRKTAQGKKKVPVGG